MNKQFIISFCLFLWGLSPIFAQTNNYTVKDGAIVGQNTGRYNNRPLYINNTNAFVLAGDQPVMRLAKDQYVFGTFMMALERNGKSKWLQHCGQVTSLYRPGKMSWAITDPEFPGLKITLEVLPMAGTTGMAICMTAGGIQKGDRILWTFGGAKWFKKQNLSWKFDVMGQPDLLSWNFNPEDCKGNMVEIKDGFRISLPDEEAEIKLFTVEGNCSIVTEAFMAEAAKWNNSEGLSKSAQADLPILAGKISPENNKPVYWAFEAFKTSEIAQSSWITNPETAFAEGKKRTDAFEERLKINTPDPYLDAVARASVAAIDGTWYPPVFVHGTMQWNSRFPGWRTIFGGTMYGWHDRVKAEAAFYCGFQIKTSEKKEAKADSATLLTEQHADSRFYGVGRIDKDRNFTTCKPSFSTRL
ncbi:MAG: DUF4450 domain-containing protein [Bacteroidales bacterium]|nr:DUF4450 domain-containing protein [Bacteroidales bacterium]